MIRDTVEIQCDKCGRHEQTQAMIDYRTSGLMAAFMANLESDGWIFERGRDHKLQRVLCPFCVKKYQSNEVE